MNTKQTNWLISYGKLIFCFSFTLAFLMAFVIHYSSFNPLNWTAADSFIFFTITIAVFFAFGSDYFISQKNIKSEKLILSIFDVYLFEKSDTKFLDCILGHYTSVATVGLFLGVLIFTFKPLIPSMDGLYFGVFLAIGYITTLLVYSLFFVRFALGIRKYNKLIYFITAFAILFLDMQVMEFFIESVPKRA